MFGRRRRPAAPKPERQVSIEEWVARGRRERQEGRVRQWSSAGYYVCSHQGCSRKINTRRHIDDHDCCGSVKHGHTY